ncbi:MAG: hypothetical protein P8L20_06995 [Flavobacteriales bacterium]|nr:hypothetical protein [Flavobacteriales bacterium]
MIKCGYKVHGTVNEWRKELPEKEAILFKKIKQLDIPELRNKEPKIAKQLFKQKLKYQIVLIDKRNMSLLNRKYTLLDLALDRPAGTAQNTIENNGFQKNAHSKSYLQSLLDHSIIDQYQDFSSIITQKKLISISNCGAEFIEKTLKNHSVQFGLIYIQKIIVSELITSLHLWVNENKFKNNLELSKYYMRICRNFDFKIISTKNLYNKYSNYLDLELKINDEKEIIKEKIKEIENILEKEKNQLTNLLLFAIAILELITVFIDDIRDQTAHIFKLNNDIINHIISVSLVIICTLIIYLFLKKTKL